MNVAGWTDVIVSWSPGGTFTGCITCTLLYWDDGTGDGRFERLIGDTGWGWERNEGQKHGV